MVKSRYKDIKGNVLEAEPTWKSLIGFFTSDSNGYVISST